VPAAQRASEASLRQRNRSLLDENQRLRAENTALKDELALAYGEQRRAPRLA
jgi:regulator of replication initiation timing